MLFVVMVTSIVFPSKKWISGRINDLFKSPFRGQRRKTDSVVVTVHTFIVILLFILSEPSVRGLCSQKNPFGPRWR